MTTTVLEPGHTLGPYQIRSFLAAGGMGAVYRAHDPRTGRDVAIKVAAECFNERFSQEVRAVAALNHPNICTLYDVGPDYLVMELVEGPTVAERIKRGAIRFDEAMDVARQAADALDAAHEKGIVHRDLKPANVKIKPDGTVKVLDFGLAKLVDAAGAGLQTGPDATNSPTLLEAASRAGVIMGTAAYMAPEQARGKPVDKRVDIWAFGVLVYEMLAGRQLFEGETVSDTLAAVLTKEPDWISVPAQARLLIRRCLEKDPKRRLRDIGDAMALLNTPAESVRHAGSRWIPWTAAAVVSVAAMVALWAPWRPQPRPPDVKRYQIPMTTSDPFVEFSVSPDGRYLAYMRRERGMNRLWLHALDSLQPWSPSGGESPSRAPVFPFWSPDSRYVAVALDGKLRKFSVSGGPPQTICDVPMQRNIAGAWSRDGVILVGMPDGLLRVSDKGGTTTRVPGVRKGGAYFPSFLPDGRHFLYTSSPDEFRSEGIYVGSLDAADGTSDGKRLLAADAAAVFAPDPAQSADSGRGYLLFRRESALLAQAFDASHLSLGGDAVPFVDQIGRFAIFPAYTASSNVVVVHHGESVDRTNSQLTWFDRQGRRLGTVGEPAPFNAVTLSPDGTRVAVRISDRATSTSDIWVLDVVRGVQSRLTFGPEYATSPVWSPDSRRIAFSSRDSRIYRKPADGAGEAETLLTVPGNPSSWSPDGRSLLYSAFTSTDSKFHLWVLPLEPPSKPFMFVNGSANDRDGTFSPDGRWVAYLSDETAPSDIYVRPFPMSTGGKWIVSKGARSAPAWRGDSKELFYISPDDSIMAVDIRATSVIQAGEPKALFKLSAGSNVFASSPDGSRFLVPVRVATATDAATVPYTVVLNWQSALTARERR